MSLCSVPVLISTGGVVLKPQWWSRQRYRQRYIVVYIQIAHGQDPKVNPFSYGLCKNYRIKKTSQEILPFSTIGLELLRANLKFKSSRIDCKCCPYEQH